MNLVSRLGLGIQRKIIQRVEDPVNRFVLGAPVHSGNPNRLRMVIPVVIRDNILGVSGAQESLPFVFFVGFAATAHSTAARTACGIVVAADTARSIIRIRIRIRVCGRWIERPCHNDNTPLLGFHVLAGDPVEQKIDLDSQKKIELGIDAPDGDLDPPATPVPEGHVLYL